MGPRAGEGAKEGRPGPAGTPATPCSGRREGEGQLEYRESRRTRASERRSRKGIPAPLSQPLSGPWAPGPGASLRLFKFKREFLKSAEDKVSGH